MPEMLASLETEIQNDNAAQTFEIAHRIKSSSSSIGRLPDADRDQRPDQRAQTGSIWTMNANQRPQALPIDIP